MLSNPTEIIGLMISALDAMGLLVPLQVMALLLAVVAIYDRFTNR